MKKNNKIPEEVLYVMAIVGSSKGTFYCGVDLYNKIESIIDKYPEYFPQQHIYKKIPQSVKDKFAEEKYELYKKHNIFLNETKEGEGIVSFMNRRSEEMKNMPERKIEDVLRDFINRNNEYQKQLKILHDKHFKSYGYKFTE